MLWGADDADVPTSGSASSASSAGRRAGAEERREAARRALDLLRRAADPSVGVLDRCARRWLLDVMIDLAQGELDEETRSPSPVVEEPARRIGAAGRTC